MLRVAALVVTWAIPALLEDAVGALRHTLAMSWCAVVQGGVEGERVMTASAWPLGAVRPAPVCGYHFALAAVGELVAKPAGAQALPSCQRIVTWCLGHQLGSVSVVGSSAGGAGGFRAPFPVGLPVVWACMAAATAAAICSSSDRAWA
jgi:hypothetical protein